MTTEPTPKLVLELADQIEAELKKLGMWRGASPPTAKPTGAFGAGAMTFVEWLEFVFLQRLRDAAQTGTFPNSSSVAIAAVRNLDGYPGTDQLIELLTRVDRLMACG